MAIRTMTDLTTTTLREARSRLRLSACADGAAWPHVGECAFAGMTPRVGDVVEQRNGGRVSAAGEAM